MIPALETLMLAFSGEEGLQAPDRTLFLGARTHPDLKQFPAISGWQPHKAFADTWENAGFERLDEPIGKWPLVMLLPGKSRDETLAYFAMARDHLQDGGCLICAMPNTAGAARFEKTLATACGPLHSIQKNKCRAFYATHNDNWDDSRFDEWRELGRPQAMDAIDFVSQAGVFSHGRIDKGSELMAQHMPGSLRGTVADLGAGWGYLTRSALECCPAIQQIDAYEIDSRAIDCARSNLATYLHKVQFFWHDVAAHLPEAAYDAIISNPPFHSGQETDLNLAVAFLTQASRALKRGGSLHLVANRQLPYERVLDSLNLAWHPVAQNDQFKIITATKR